MQILFFLSVTLFLGTTSSYPQQENDAKYWDRIGSEGVQQAVGLFQNLNNQRAKNVILLVGDGMNLATSTAGRVYMGQESGQTGEEYVTSIDSLPHVGISKTYSVNYQSPDSAATATAMLCGVKTKNGMLGVTAATANGNCASSKNNHVTSALEKAIAEGKSTGIVTTTRVQHATPAAAYAKSAARRWYSDSSLPAEARIFGCPDIAKQLFNQRFGIQVILGGGRSHMRPRSVQDEENTSQRGDRNDGRDLIAEWESSLGDEGLNSRYVWNLTEFNKVNTETTDHLLGLFSPFEMQYALNRQNDRGGQPTLAQMVEKAIRILQKNENGFFLVVESGMLDKAHHAGHARYALKEFEELDSAVKMARQLTSEDNTLIVTTSDHGHMFTFGSGAVRGNKVTGLAPSQNAPSSAVDGKKYTSMLYGNGPGHSFINTGSPIRQSIGSWVATNQWYRPQSAVPLRAGTHSSEDVMIYASGPMAHLFHGVHEQSYIAHVMNYAACLGNEYKNLPHCQSAGGAKIVKRSLDEVPSMEQDGFESEQEVEDEEAY